MATTSETLVPILLPSGATRCKRISEINADEIKSAIAIISESKERLIKALTNPPPVCNPPKLLKNFIASAEEKLIALHEKLASLETNVASDGEAAPNEYQDKI